MERQRNAERKLAAAARDAAADSGARQKMPSRAEIEGLATQAATRPTPGADVPVSFSFLPAPHNLLVFLATEDGSDFRYLAAVDTENFQRRNLLKPAEGNTEENLSLEEKLRRERQRAQIVGVTSYGSCGPKGLLVPLNGCLYLLDPADASANLRVVLPKDELPALDPRASGDGSRLAFVRGSDLYVMKYDDSLHAFGEPVLLSYPFSNKTSGVTNGLASFLAQEELDRQYGYWWSHDGHFIAYEHVDERQVPAYKIVHQGEHVDEETHRYPFAGEKNPLTQLYVTHVDARLSGDKSPSEALDLTMSTGETDVYLGRVDWFDNAQLLVQVLNREQTKLELLIFDLNVKPARRRLLLREESKCWINLHDVMEELDRPHHFLWSNERDGFQHIYLYKYDPSGQGEAELVRQVTSGEFVVEAIAGLDESNDLMYFMGSSEEDPTQRHMYVCRIVSDEVGQAYLRLTPEGSSYTAMDAKCQRYVLHNSSLMFPPTVTLEQVPSADVIKTELAKRFAALKNDGLHVLRKRSKLSVEPKLIQFPSLREVFESGIKPQDTSLALKSTCLNLIAIPGDLKPLLNFASTPPALLKFTLGDSGDTLYAHAFIPYGQGPFKTIVQVYGGPHVQRVKNEWYSTMDIRAQILRNLGYMVVRCDNRGSARRGLEFEGHIHHKMGTIELEDQISCLKVLAGMGLCDMEHVGITGWSYGGYLTAMALVKHPEIFKVGISGAPVTSWDGYDTAYTERYMGTPQSNPAGYSDGSVMTHIDKLEGKLLLVHGLVDENVHFRHTARLIDAMIRQGKMHDLLILPEERHGPRKLAARIYLENRILSYFLDNL